MESSKISAVKDLFSPLNQQGTDTFGNYNMMEYKHTIFLKHSINFKHCMIKKCVRGASPIPKPHPI